MKIKKSHLKELIRQSIREIDFKNQAAFDAYNKKHKMRKTTKVNVGGKETTAGDAEKKGKPTKDMDSKSASDNAQDFLTGKNAEANIDKLNDLAADDKPVQFDTDDGQSLTWDDGDMDNGTVLAYDQDGGEVEVDFSDIVRMDMDLPKADRGNKALFSDPEPEDDSGGPSYAGVPKGAKSSAQAKTMKNNDSISKKLGHKDTKDLAMGGSADELNDFLDSIPDEGQDFNEAEEIVNYIRDNEQGVRNDDDDVVDGYRGAFLGMVNKPGAKGKGSGKSAKDTGKEMDKAADDANTKMDRAELADAHKKLEKMKKELNALYDKGDREGMKKKNAEIMKFNKTTILPLEKKLQGESIKESKKRRFTVKEVKKWMKALEENRYKRVYHSDARRVAWMVNNMGENVANMPVSMRKKWTKAQYGRERYLAKEFVKHSYSKELNENKIRKVIRRILIEAKRRELEIHVRDKVKVDKILKKLKLKSGKDYDIGYGSSRSFMLDVDVKHLDKVVTILMKNRINVK